MIVKFWEDDGSEQVEYDVSTVEDIKECLIESGYGFHPDTGEIMKREEIPLPEWCGQEYEDWLNSKVHLLLYLKDGSEFRLRVDMRQLLDSDCFEPVISEPGIRTINTPEEMFNEWCQKGINNIIKDVDYILKDESLPSLEEVFDIEFH